MYCPTRRCTTDLLIEVKMKSQASHDPDLVR